MKPPSVSFDYKKTHEVEFEIIDLIDLAKRKFNHSHPDLPHKVSFFNLIYFSAGQGTHMVDFVDYEYQPGTVIFVQMDQVQAYNFSDNLEGKVILFTQGFLDQVHANMRLPNYTPTHLNDGYMPLINLDVENHQRCRRLIEEISLEVGSQNYDPLVAMYLFSALSMILHRLRPQLGIYQLSENQSIKFARFMELLAKRYHQIRDANWYANELCISYKTLNQLCKQATELTIKQLIDAYTVVEVKRKLLVGNLSTQQIAFDHGFEDSSNFIKYFKKHTGMTPSQFQKKYHSPNLTRIKK